MIILGIDPGTVTMGYGAIEEGGEGISLVGYGALVNRPRSQSGSACAIFMPVFWRLSPAINPMSWR